MSQRTPFTTILSCAILVFGCAACGSTTTTNVSDGGSSGTNDGIECSSPVCPNDPPPDSNKIAQCEQELGDPKCGALTEAAGVCLATHCTAQGTSDLVACSMPVVAMILCLHPQGGD